MKFRSVSVTPVFNEMVGRPFNQSLFIEEALKARILNQRIIRAGQDYTVTETTPRSDRITAYVDGDNRMTKVEIS